MTKKTMLAPLFALAVALSATPAIAQSAQPAPGATPTASNPIRILIGLLLPAPQLPRDAARR